MFKWRVVFAVLAALSVPAAITMSIAQIVGTLPFTLQNNTVADANQVMANFNAIKNDTNTNAANAGVNTNITALNGLTTPISYTAGGTSHYIAGLSTGAANAQVVSSPVPNGFTLVTGKTISFLAGFTNTGATTLNVASTGVKNVYRQSPTGPVAMSGGEIVAGNLINATYDGTQYQVEGASPQQLVATGTLADFVGVTIPSGWLAADGTAVSRSTYATLFTTLTHSAVAATTTSGSATLDVPDSSLFQVGWSVGGNNVTCNSTILSIGGPTSITISNNAGASGATTLSIGPYAQGDCSTTFTLPNFTGRMAAGTDGSARITSATCTNAGSLGSYCGAQTHTLTQAELSVALGTATTTIPAVGVPQGVAANVLAQAGGTSVLGPASAISGLTATTTITNGSGGNAHTILNPIGMVTKIIKF